MKISRKIRTYIFWLLAATYCFMLCPSTAHAQSQDGGSVITLGQAMQDGVQAPPSKIIMAVLALLMLGVLAIAFFVAGAGIVGFMQSGEWNKVYPKLAGMVMLGCLAGFMGWLIYLEGANSSISTKIGGLF